MAENITKPEIWQTGPVENIPALLQPVAHALLQANIEVVSILEGFPKEKLWEKPAGTASIGFHLLHLTGVLDRLFTYSKGETLTPDQLEYLKNETIVHNELTIEILENRFDEQVKKCLDQLSKTKEDTLAEPRSIGRKKIPTTTIGLLFHAAEHTMRHIGQLLVTAKVLKTVDFLQK